MKKVLFAVLVLAVTSSGCWVDALIDPDGYVASLGATSVDVTRDFEMASDALIVLVWVVFSFLGALVAGLIFGWRRRQ